MPHMLPCLLILFIPTSLIIDMNTVGGIFTWRRNGPNGSQINKKLDRCLANSDWHLTFPHALVELLPPYNSDHIPIFSSVAVSHIARPLVSFISRLRGSLIQGTLLWLNRPGTNLA